MNRVVLVGNLVRDPEFTATPDGTPVCDFTIAVQRKRKDKSGTYPADFIRCTAWNGTAEFVRKYFLKGSPIGVDGELQTRKYTTKNGDERHVTEVVVASAEFVGRKAERKPDPLDEFGSYEINESDLPF